MNLLEIFCVPKSPTRLIPFLLAIIALFALPLSLAVAQDFEAVEKRLAKGVVKGELSLQQAAAMMEMLHEIAEEDDEEEDEDDEDFRAAMKDELENVGAELREAVMRGEMSEKEAWRAWGEFKENEFAPQLKRAVRNGMMSEKEAWMWWGKNLGDVCSNPLLGLQSVSRKDPRQMFRWLYFIKGQSLTPGVF